LLPIIPVSADIVEEQLVEEEYITLEPYTVQKEVQEPYTSYETRSRLEYTEDYMMWKATGNGMPSSPSTYSVAETIPITKYRTVVKEVTEYREVTKKHMVLRPVVVTQTERASVLSYLMR
jgi:hypothetical protein